MSQLTRAIRHPWAATPPPSCFRLSTPQIVHHRRSRVSHNPQAAIEEEDFYCIHHPTLYHDNNLDLREHPGKRDVHIRAAPRCLPFRAQRSLPYHFQSFSKLPTRRTKAFRFSKPTSNRLQTWRARPTLTRKIMTAKWRSCKPLLPVRMLKLLAVVFLRRKREAY